MHIVRAGRRRRHHRARDHAADPAGQPIGVDEHQALRGQLDADERPDEPQRERAGAAELHDRQLAAQPRNIAILHRSLGLEGKHEILAHVQDIVGRG